MSIITLRMAWLLPCKPLRFHVEADNFGLLECICRIVDYDPLYRVRWPLPVVLTAST